jgi:hypothetical protein
MKLKQKSLGDKMKTRATPGPWMVEDYGLNKRIIGGNGNLAVADVAMSADAALIAAAPDLLSALIKCEDIIGMAQLQGKLSDNACSPVNDALVAARKALDKVRGE